jgi:endoglucanase
VPVLALLLTSCGGGSNGGGAIPVVPAPAPSPSPAPSPAPSPSPTPTPGQTAVAFSAQMSPGWNLGNSLESLSGAARPSATSLETAYGNPPVTQAMLDAVAAAGFKSVRIPVAWTQYSDANYTITDAWLARVKEVVDYARHAGLYVVINIHYDGGWMQPTYAQQAGVNARLKTFWTQIADEFRDYDDHLLFAGTNEVAVTNVYTAPTTENCAVQNSFNQTFVDAVRATAGNNAARYLVVQGYNTNIDYTVSCNSTLPKDTAQNRLMMEVHYYDPYNFTLNQNSNIWQWGSTATDPSLTEQSYGGEAYTDAEFEKMKEAFVDKGVPVILGEYGAISKTQYDPSGNYRTLWDQYITHSAFVHGIVPMYWDNGSTGNYGLGLFDRSTGAQVYPATLQAIVRAAR